MYAKEPEIDADQLGINVGAEILAQITEGLVDEDNIKDGGKIINKPADPAPHLSVGTPFQDQEDACPQGITPEQRSTERNLVPKKEN
jgi:hypothetical protein